jgi:hypothetical protein
MAFDFKISKHCLNNYILRKNIDATRNVTQAGHFSECIDPWIANPPREKGGAKDPVQFDNSKRAMKIFCKSFA